jgi:hypothetical protein
MMACAVNSRTGEIGLRIALGSTGQPGSLPHIARSILSDGRRYRARFDCGSVAHAIHSSHALRRAGTDALTVDGTVALLIAVSLLAAFTPPRRASRIDPIRALRHD